MPRQDQPDMNDVTDADLHRPEGVDPYPVPAKTKKASRPVDDETTSTEENNHERGEADADGVYIDAADKMRVTVDEQGQREAWKRGQTQGKGA